MTTVSDILVYDITSLHTNNTMERQLNEYGYRIDPAYLLDEVTRLSRHVNRLTDIVCVLSGAVVGILVAVILT